MLLNIHHVQITIPPGAEDQARQFYCRLLGLKEISKPESLRKRGGFWLELGAAQVHIGTEDAVERSKSKAHVAYQVTNLDEWRAILIRSGVQIFDGISIPGIRRFEFRDPFGNRVEFLERL